MDGAGIVEFKHVILTRFNLATPGREQAIRNQPGWLEHRFQLFERFCLPTIAAQTNKNFLWVIFFDQETPEEFKNRIEHLRHVQEFYPYYTGLFPSDGWGDAIRDVLGAQNPQTHLLTTRLDNDDGLAFDFVDRLHNSVFEIDTIATPIALNFACGFVLARNKLYAHRHKSNAFASLLEPFDEQLRTISTIPHMDLEKHVALRQIEGSGAWLQVIHETNVSNKIRGVRVSTKDARLHFPSTVAETFKDVSKPVAVLENLTLGSARSLRDRLLELRKKIRDFKSKKRNNQTKREGPVESE